MAFSVTLSPEQYDIVWEDLRLGEQPYPIAIRGHGKTMRERALIRNRVYGELTARRLADGHRLEPVLEQLLVRLGRPAVWLDMIWLPEREARVIRNALVARSGDDGLLAELLPEGGLRLTNVHGTAAVHALLDLLPRTDAAPGRSISLPAEALAPASPVRHGDDDRRGIMDEPPPAGAAAGQQLRTLQALFVQPRVRSGQIGVNCRDRHGRRARGRTLEWFDTADGRYLAQLDEGRDGRDPLVVVPADNTRIVARLHEMINTLASAVFA
jgi:EspG family